MNFFLGFIWFLSSAGNNHYERKNLVVSIKHLEVRLHTAE